MKVSILPLCLLAFLFAFPGQAFVVEANAATIVVDTAADTLTNGGGCSLREAITNANADAATIADCTAGSGADTINFDASLAGQTITLSLGQLVISSSITIDATGVANLSVSGNNASRVFDITTATAVVVMTGFRITGGNGSPGGGIRNTGDLTFNNMTVQSNAGSGSGGGVYTLGTGNRLTINGGFISANTASSGGGIHGVTSLVISLTNVTVSGNTASIDGGGVFALGGTLNIMGGSVTSNTATNNAGGGIVASGTTLTATNASITNNHADGSQGRGGGMYIDGGSSTISNSTLIP